jgi:glycosyltransferase involved in cell wall biosynthesis
VTLVYPSSERPKIVVLDANFYWTEQLFSECSTFADILLFRPYDSRTFFKRYRRYFIDWHPHFVSENVWEHRICCPPGWLFHYWPLTRLFFAHLIRQFQGNSPVIIVYCYPYYHTITRCVNAFSIYYSMDEYSGYWPGREQQTETLEMQSISSADITVCIANYRYRYFKQLYANEAHKIVHIPLGCSPKFMVNQALIKPNSLPDKLISYTRPIAGYVGALNDRFDFCFLAEVAVRLPQVTFVLGGILPNLGDGTPEWWQGVEKIQQLPNVFFIGQVPHDQIGNYLKAFDVLLMVYSKSSFNTNACPMKLWDYMGTSLPIVANNSVPEVSLLQHVIRVSETPEEFVANIQFVLANPNWKSSERLNVAKENTWEKQSQKLYEVIQERTTISPSPTLKGPTCLSKGRSWNWRVSSRRS